MESKDSSEKSGRELHHEPPRVMAATTEQDVTCQMSPQRIVIQYCQTKWKPTFYSAVIFLRFYRLSCSNQTVETNTA